MARIPEADEKRLIERIAYEEWADHILPKPPFSSWNTSWVDKEERKEYIKWAKFLLSIIKEAGYLPVEPVQLEVLGDEEMKSVIKENIALLDNEEKAVELLFKVSQNTNAHNEAKGQLYRVKDD